MKPKIIVFASGTATSGGSGFENLVVHSHPHQGFPFVKKDLDAAIVAVVSNHEHGGVRERADRLGVPFIYFPGPFDVAHYTSILQKTSIENIGTAWVALSGWLKLVSGLDPQKTFNIHPALLSQLGGRFVGKDMYGHHIHEAVKKALDSGEIDHSGITMHFVTPEYDRGPVFFEYPVPLTHGMSAERISKAVNDAEHLWQPKITNMVVHEEIRWDGKNPESLMVPKGLTS
jgi:phosphoribosylglycinamide formyltransferase-1